MYVLTEINPNHPNNEVTFKTFQEALDSLCMILQELKSTSKHVIITYNQNTNPEIANAIISLNKNQSLVFHLTYQKGPKYGK